MELLGNLIKRSFSMAVRVDSLAKRPHKNQERALHKLLLKAKGTAFGQAYNFDEIAFSPTMMDDFRQSVPLFDYDSLYENWWHRQLDAEPNVTWPEKIKYFALSSGTTGAPSKYIPITKEMLRRMRMGSFKTWFSLTRHGLGDDHFTKQILALSSSTNLRQSEDGYFLGDLSGINVKQTPNWLNYIKKPEPDIVKIQNWDERIDQIAKNAHKWDIGSVAGIPSWVQLMIERVLEVNKLDHIHQIWPNLNVFVHGGIAFEPHRRAFDGLTGRQLKYVDTYMASEGYFAFQTRQETRSMALLLNSGIFFEFIPFNEENFPDGKYNPNATSYTIREVQTGIDYALVISTCAGAWRYLIGDTVRFTDVNRCEIMITGRTKHFLSVSGEHLSVDNMNSGVSELQHQLNLNIREFTVAAVQSGENYAHRWYIGCDNPKDVNMLQATQILDEKLMEVNDDYATERSAMLQPIQLQMIPNQLFYQYLESLGKMGGQAKMPRVMKKEQFIAFEQFVKARL
jgi:phenylacetate-coenzyme A ligase PaaK-like adenylate-forming protein